MSGLSISKRVCARANEVAVGQVNAGERWRFKAVGRWNDWFINCDADGYRIALFEFLGIRPQVRQARWFALVGWVGDSGTFAIGTGTEHTFEHTGMLTVCANDLSFMRWNNRGFVDLVAESVPPTPDIPRPATIRQESRSLPDNWREFSKTLRRTPGFLFIACLLGFLAYALIALAPVQDLVTAVVEGGVVGSNTRWSFFLCFSTFLLSFQAWFWARAIVEYHFGDRANWRNNLWLCWVPRLFGIVPYAALIASFWRDRQLPDAPTIELIVIGATFLIFMMVRPPAIQWLEAEFDMDAVKQRSWLSSLLRSSLSGLKPVVLATSLIASFVCTFIVLVFPMRPALYIGPPGVVLLAVALVIPPTVLVIQLGYRFRLPTLTALLILMLVFSNLNDNHDVRTLHGTADDWASHKPVSLDLAYARWRKQARPVNGQLPIVFVAASGGASRAAFWTARALARLEEQTNGAFSRQLFAISAISGSSVGAVGYLASLKDNPDLPARHELVPALTDLAGRDYLSPTIAGLLAPDLLQRLLPFAALPDRASYLEQAFETGWTDHCAAEPNRCHAGDMLSQSFLSLWRNTRRPWLPALVIGGARVEDGRRILTSNISLAGAVDGEDFFDLDKHDISLATAIDNGARFPFVSPGGTLGYTDRNHKWTTSGHVVDGGYFEAAGIETLRELVSSVVARHPNDSLEVIFIVLSNYPVGEAPYTVETRQFANDLLDPLVGLYQSGAAHGSHLRHILLTITPSTICRPRKCYNLSVFVKEIRACSGQVPLDWVLSLKAQSILSGDLGRCGNPQIISDITTALGAAN